MPVVWNVLSFQKKRLEEFHAEHFAALREKYLPNSGLATQGFRYLLNHFTIDTVE